MSQVSDLRGAVLGKGYRLDRRLDDKDETEYEGTHERIPGRFIIRLFPVDTLSQAESSSRIQRGARVASLLRDPHAVQVLDFSASGDVPAFVVIERAPGRTLAAAMVEDGMAPLPRAIELIASIAAGLSAGHQIGLVHGDLRPAHVILPNVPPHSGQPLTKLSGFGWAKELRAASRVPAPSSYLAPEQDFGKVVTLDERVDQFALAVLAYELIAGCLPFSVESADLAENFGGRRTPPAIAEMVPGVPGQVDEVLRRALSFTPSDRFGSVEELVSQLRAAAAVGSSVPTPTPIVESPNIPTSHAVVETPGIPPPPPILTPILQTPGIVGAAPAMKSDNDITDELDLSTLAAVRADHDAESRDRDRHAGGVDEDEDAKLVLGPASGPVATDDAKTQIRRSPFLNDYPDADEAGQGSPRHTPSAPRRGVPTGRPATLEGANVNDSQRLVAPPARSSLVGTWLSLARDKFAPPWNQFRKRWAWTLPATLAVALAVGAGLWMARASDNAPTTPPHTASNPISKNHVAALATPARAATPKAVAPLAKMPTPVAPAPTAPPARVAGSNHATGTEVPQPSPPSPTIVAHAEPVPPAELAPGPSAITANRQTFSPQRGLSRRLTARHAIARTAALTPSRPVAAADPGPAPAPSQARPPTGGPGDCSVHIVSKPWTQVWIDGKDTGLRTPVDNLKVPCGMRKLQLKRPDKDIEQMEMLNVVAGKPFQGKYDLK